MCVRMKAVLFDNYGNPDVLYVGETGAPVPKADEVLIRVEAAGVSRADSMQRQGNYPPPPGASEILGLDVAGVIEEVGDDVTAWRRGDRVCALVNGGGYAELVAVPQGQVLPVPEGWNVTEATTLPENGFTVFDNMVTRARLRSGETVLVHGGTSGIGSTAIMFARALGAAVIATAGTPEKCQACLRIGAQLAIDYKRQDFVEETLRLTAGRGADIIVDIVCGEYIMRDIRALAMDGRVACIAPQGGVMAEINIASLMQKRGTIFGTSLRPRSSAEKAAIAAALRESIWPLLPARDSIAPLVDRVYTFAEAAEAHKRMEASAHVGKIVLTPRA
jgi:NADPH2:quinone reductase